MSPTSTNAVLRLHSLGCDLMRCEKKSKYWITAYKKKKLAGITVTGHDLCIFP
ncbi:uncharacterized protein G2W53_017159 [Senna tora]|uniref:Uncharacterized protein n=1 Tax=Senna tora TaxID=362788 RepID=A0A834WJX4_9FABA|nr:uncharacterized protein G2W53_017159 [Senna tora]